MTVVVIDRHACTIRQRAYLLVVLALVGIVYHLGVEIFQLLMSDKLIFRNILLNHSHALHLVTVEGDDDTHYEIGSNRRLIVIVFVWQIGLWHQYQLIA